MLPSGAKTTVIVIVTHRPTLSEWEEISLRQCGAVLHDHDIVLVCPKGMNTSAHTSVLPRIRVLPIRPHWLSSYTNFSHFKLSPVLYRAFQRDYRDILFYELDAFVFRDELAMWCDRGFDYLGAPWFSGRPDYNNDSVIVGAGNGGFSLRNIRSHVRANRSLRYLTRPSELWREFRIQKTASNRRVKPALVLLLKLLGVGNNTFYYLRAPLYYLGGYVPPEDIFWTEHMAPALSWFKVADPESATEFSFEILPRKLYEMNGRRLPFGCHGWYRFDWEFWRPFVEAEGHDLPEGPPPEHHEQPVTSLPR